MWRQLRYGDDNGIAAILEEEDPHQEGPLLITLSGLGQAMSEKNYLFSNLRKRMAEDSVRTVQFDYRGHGDSVGELGEVSITSMVRDTLEVVSEIVQERKITELFFVGHALGAIVAMQASIEFQKGTGIPCQVILISPPLAGLEQSFRLFSPEVLKRLETEGSIDSQLLVPGYDYYTLSDFNMEQVEYLYSLGAHLLYLHGQRIGHTMIQELDAFDPLTLFHSGQQPIHMICGDKDQSNLELAGEVPGAQVHVIKDVIYYHQHPQAMDDTIEIINHLVKELLSKQSPRCTQDCSHCSADHLMKGRGVRLWIHP